MGDTAATDQVTKAEASEILGLSERAVTRHAQAGRLTPRYYDRPQGGQEVRYDRAEVEALRQALTEPRPDTVPSTRPPADPARQIALFAEAVRAVRDDRDEPAPVSVPLTERLLLTIPEAAALTGLGVGQIERAIAGGLLEARDLGPRGSRVVRRDDLSSLVEMLWGPRRNPKPRTTI